MSGAQRGGFPGLIDALRTVRGRRVIGLVFATAGSTYQKPGAMMLLDAGGFRYGVVSGGCLEPEVEEAARNVLSTGCAGIVDFDMRSDEDIDFGSGTGCQGRVRLLLIPQADDSPLTQALFALADSDEALALSVVCEGNGTGGGCATLGGATWRWDRSGDAATVPLEDAIALRIEPPPRVLLLGAGAESGTLQEFVRRLGWRSLCVEHRGRWLGFAQRAGVDEVIEQPPQTAAAVWRNRRVDAAIAMSHNFSIDATSLRLLADTDIAYVGLLGPASRSDRLLAEIGADAAQRLQGRLHAPVGLVLGGSGPDVLALSIAAELQRHFATRTR